MTKPPRHQKVCISFANLFSNTATTQWNQAIVVFFEHQRLDILWEILER